MLIPYIAVLQGQGGIRGEKGETYITQVDDLSYVCSLLQHRPRLSMAEIILLTCPSGKQCSHLIPLLYSNPRFKLRLAAHSSASAARLHDQYPNAEIIQSDISILSDCVSLLKDASIVFHVGPSFHTREQEMGINMIDAAVHESQRPGNKFRHFVFSSVLSTQLRNLQQHDLKSFVEERLFLSPLIWTVLKPTNFMDAYPVPLLASQEHPMVQKLWKPDTPNSVVALRDIAEAAEKVIVAGPEVHGYASYDLCSTLPMSDRTIIEKIGMAIGKTIEIKAPSFEVGVENCQRYLFGGKQSDVYAYTEHPEYALAAEGDLRGDIVRDRAERLVLFYSRRGLKGSPNVLRWLLGREPTTVEEWVQLQLK